jgi:membrane-bound serine protease (ClpP class)
MMEILFDPNIAYILLAGGLVFTVLAVLNPGTGLLEIGALFMLLLAGVSVYGLASQDMINWWSLLIILVGVFFFVVALRIPKQPVYLVLSITLLVLGSVYMFRSEVWYVPSVNPYLAIVMSLLSGGFFWLTARKVLETRDVMPTHDLKALIGDLGEAKSYIHKDGSVQVAGELWTARSDEPIQNGEDVRVIGRDGFVLLVEAVSKELD